MRKVLMMLILIPVVLFGGEVDVADYAKPLTATDEAWEAVQPYLFLKDKGVKRVLDELFGKERITSDRESLMAKGFVFTPIQGLHVVVAAHKKLKGYLVKVIVDKYEFNREGLEEDWVEWIKRIEGEKVVRKGIATLGYKDLFKVPRQWIYPLPNEPKPIEEPGYEPKSFILIVEDMKLEDKKKNAKHYRQMEKWEMEAIYLITTECGMADCCNRNNLPLCKDGRLAFVDTEIYNRWPVDYHQMLQYLSDRGKEYWKKLTHNGGAKKK
jgi:hypothetical protein